MELAVELESTTYGLQIHCATNCATLAYISSLSQCQASFRFVSKNNSLYPTQQGGVVTPTGIEPMLPP